MKLSTEEKAKLFIKSKGGEIIKVEKKGTNYYYHVLCKNGHTFKKEKRKLLYKEEYCNLYPCSKGKKTDWKSEQGFKIFKKRLKGIFKNEVICIETDPVNSKKFRFKCTKCQNEWVNSPSYQIFTPKRKNRPPSCKNCGGSLPTSNEKKEAILNDLNISAIDGIQSIKNQQSKFSFKCNNCGSKGYKTLNNLLELNKNELGYCDCTYKRVHWNIHKLKTAGEENGYRLLDNPKLINTSELYKWKCKKEGHITYFPIGSLKNGCKTCYNESRFTCIEDVQKWLSFNAPTITIKLNQEWGGSHAEYIFKCETCHTEFSKHIHNLIKVPKCKNVTRSYSEIIVQFYLEKLLGISFVPNKKYNFLINSNGNKMELDGYNSEHQIAFEHHGIQHYENNIWHQGKNTLRKRTIDDRLKREQCESHGVKLIEIPAIFEITPLNEIKNVIKDEFIRLNIQIPDNFDDVNPDLKELVIYHKKSMV